MGEKSKKVLSPEEFVLLAIKKLRKPEHQGIHTVYSGFNSAFREYFPGQDPVATVQELVAKKKLKLRPARGGVVIFPPDVEVVDNNDAKQALNKMGLG